MQYIVQNKLNDREGYRMIQIRIHDHRLLNIIIQNHIQLRRTIQNDVFIKKTCEIIQNLTVLYKIMHNNKESFRIIPIKFLEVFRIGIWNWKFGI